MCQIGVLQTWLLYHNALSSGVAIEDILKYARKTKERAGSEEDTINELKAQVAQQERLIRQLLNAETKPTYGSTSLSSNPDQSHLLSPMERRPSISKQPTGSSVASKHVDTSKDVKVPASDASPQMSHTGVSVKEPHVDSKTDDVPSPTDGDGVVRGMVKTIEEAVKGKQPMKEASPVKGVDKKSSTSAPIMEGDANKASTSSSFSTSMSWWATLLYLFPI